MGVTYDVFVDDEAHSVTIRADYVVFKDGARYVAEVKTGRTATRIDSAATRRQLLEYRHAFDVDGVLLVDADSGTIHSIGFEPRARELLLAYPWPGNVRELSHVVERAVLWSRGDLLGSEHLSLEIPAAPTEPAPPADGRGDSESLAPAGTDLETWERTLIERALRESDGNQTRAAQRLGISRDTLRYRLKKYGIQG